MAGVVATGVASSACGVTTVAASASETPRRWARAVSERAGVSPGGAQRRQQCGQEDVNPLIGFALDHAE